MPKSPERKAETRRRILEAACRLLGREGLEGAGIAEIMADAGLTHGGFYAHFRDKDALVAEVIETAMADVRERWLAGLEAHSPDDAYRRLVGRYISPTHRDMPARGCPMPALGSETARHDDEVREAFERALIGTLGALEVLIPATGRLSPRERAMATIALAVGGLMISRMVSDEEFSDAILLACRRAAVAGLSPSQASR